MKHFFSRIFAATSLIASFSADAQNLPTSATGPSGSVTNVLTAPQNFNPSTANTYNFSRTWVPDVPITSETNAAFALHPSSLIYYSTQASTTYYNGWGKTIESILRGVRLSSTIISDIVTPYDLRPSLTQNKFLPYKAPACSQFLASAFSDEATYYASAYINEGASAYSQSVLSYPNQIPTVSSYSPGMSFVGQANGSANGSVTSTTFNDPNDPDQQIIEYLYNNSLTSSGNYGANQLTVKTSLSPYSGKVMEFYDKNGRIICKKVATQGGANANYMTTYYVYDALSKLRMIITPQGVQNNMTTDDYVNRYTYDGFGNIAAKKMPGQADWQTTVYDARRRPVLFRNALLAADGKYWYTIYDSRDRVAIQGYITDLNTPDVWQGWLDNPSTIPTSSNYRLIDVFENGLPAGYSTSLSIYNCEIDVVNYYDTYPTASPFPSSAAFDNSYSSDYLTSGASTVIPVPYMFTQGMLTASLVKVMGTDMIIQNQWIASEYFYDQKGHLIQAQTLNPFNNTSNLDVTTSQYAFNGHKLLDIFKYYDRTSSTKPDVKIVKRYNYDDEHRDRLTGITESIDNNSTRPLSSYTYDDFERVSKKSLGAVEDQHYDYNIRGQLSGINADYCINGSTSPQASNATYGSILCYDYGFADPRFDGKLSGMLWRGSDPSYFRAYGYDYDVAGRLTAAEYNEEYQTPLLSSNWGNLNRDYTMYGVTYDKNGNMLTLNHMGNAIINSNTSPTPVNIDVLNYSYSGNQLQYVSDGVTTNYNLGDFQDVTVHCQGSNTICPDYAYDADGNMKSDANKAITSIIYNYQDKPTSVNFANGSSIANIYDAAGNLLVKQVSDPNPSPAVNDKYHYWGPFNYRNDSLLFVLHDEGRTRYQADSGLFKYDYFVKDHLGNVRSMVTADPYPAVNYWAGYEVANANFEDAIFNNVSNIAHPKPGGTSGDQKAGLMNGSDSSRIGTSLMLHVMAGDKFDVNADGYWDSDSCDNCYADSITMVSSLFSTLMMNDGGQGLGGENNASQLVNSMYHSLSGNLGAFQGIINQATSSGVPRAYLNYMVFDERMNFLPDQSGAVQIGSTPSTWQNVQLPSLTAQQNGYMVFYMSNATLGPVNMDHFSIYAYKGRLLQEQNYYPFGLAINEGAAPGQPNKYLYQTNKLQDELGLNLSDFHARQYDAQIGRFHGIDPKDQFPSGYTGMGNDPANKIDPSGMSSGTFFHPGYGGPLPSSSENVPRVRPQSDDGLVRLDDLLDWLQNYYGLEILDILPGAGQGKMRDLDGVYIGSSDEGYTKVAGFGSDGGDGSGSKGVNKGCMFISDEQDKQNVTTNTPPWLNTANNEIGISETKDPDRVGEYFKSTGYLTGSDPSSIAWCGAFVNWTMKQNGIDGPSLSGLATSWKNFGTQLDQPAYGSLAIISYGGGHGHIGIVVGQNDKGQIILLGGNQHDQVSLSPFNSSKISYYVYPNGYTPNYSLPQVNVYGNTLNYNQTR